MSVEHQFNEDIHLLCGVSRDIEAVMPQDRSGWVVDCLSLCVLGEREVRLELSYQVKLFCKCLSLCCVLKRDNQHGREIAKQQEQREAKLHEEGVVAHCLLEYWCPYFLSLLLFLAVGADIAFLGLILKHLPHLRVLLANGDTFVIIDIFIFALNLLSEYELLTFD